MPVSDTKEMDRGINVKKSIWCHYVLKTNAR
jgi:hypothetical protein